MLVQPFRATPSQRLGRPSAQSAHDAAPCARQSPELLRRQTPRHRRPALYLYPCWRHPNSDETLQFLHWLVLGATALHRKVVLVIWDNASWHVGRKVKRWIRCYNLNARLTGRPRLLVWALPKRSPWLNPIEPHWLHAKKRICEPSNVDLSPHQLRQRVFQALDARFVAALSQPVP